MDGSFELEVVRANADHWERECKKLRACIALLEQQPQPPPRPSRHPAVWDLVVADMAQRDRTGQARYGTRLQPFNGRDALRDAYEESLDLSVYLRQAIYERDNK
jgi:hypothetical protein